MSIVNLINFQDEDSDAPPVLTEPIEVEPSPSPGPPSGQHTTYGTIAD